MIVTVAMEVAAAVNYVKSCHVSTKWSSVYNRPDVKRDTVLISILFLYVSCSV